MIAAATLIGLGLNYGGIDPIRALVFTAVFNGVAAVPLLFLIARIARNREVMGAYRSGMLSTVLVWCTVASMGAAAIALFVTLASIRAPTVATKDRHEPQSYPHPAR